MVTGVPKKLSELLISLQYGFILKLLTLIPPVALPKRTVLATLWTDMEMESGGQRGRKRVQACRGKGQVEEIQSQLASHPRASEEAV